MLTRSKGHTAIGAAAHLAGERLTDRRTGRVYDFAYKSPHVVYAEILLPEGAAAFMRDRATLWQYVERIEDGHSRSRDAQLARDVNLALPRELSRAANIVLARSFVLAEFVALGMVCDFAIHEQLSATDGLIQPHLHGLLSLRQCTPEGFGRKVRAWGSRALFNAWREHWAAYVNAALAWAGMPERVDHRSLKAQGIDREPRRYLRRAEWERERRGLAPRSTRGVAQEAALPSFIPRKGHSIIPAYARMQARIAVLRAYALIRFGNPGDDENG
jgi:ATP-dependent exoDNAse (exonuclease V) alpha subunit